MAYMKNISSCLPDQQSCTLCMTLFLAAHSDLVEATSIFLPTPIYLPTNYSTRVP